MDLFLYVMYFLDTYIILIENRCGFNEMYLDNI